MKKNLKQQKNLSPHLLFCSAEIINVEMSFNLAKWNRFNTLMALSLDYLEGTNPT